MSGGANSVTMKLDLAGLNGVLAEIGHAVEYAARPAAQAAAQVLYDEVLKNVARIKRKTGNLSKSIYQAYSPSNSGVGHATYHVSWRTSKGSAFGRAPHGHLVEFGHLQRYKTYVGNDGQVRTMVRPGMDGTNRPGRKASQAAKDAYYVPLEGGPRQVAARPFLRPAWAKAKDALDAAEAVLRAKVNEAAR